MSRMPGSAVAALVAIAGIVAAAPAAKADIVSFNSPLGGPGFFNGTGNPDAGFTVDVNTATNTQLGLEAIERHVGPYTPSGNVYSAPLGTVGGLPHWNFQFSANLRADGTGTSTLGGLSLILTMHDVGLGTTGSFDLMAIPDSAGWNGAKNLALANLGTDYIVQNSESLGFATIAALLGDPGFNPNANDTYDFSLQAFETDTAGPPSLLASDSIVVDAGTGAVPEPGALFVFASGLLVLSLLPLRRRQR